MSDKWTRRFIDLARHVSTWSKDPSTQVGAVIVDSNNRVVSLGYNGFAKGVKDTDERLNDRALKLSLIVHAERNAIIFAKQDLAECRLYTWPFLTCSSCAALVINSGITEVTTMPSDNPRWVDDFKKAEEQYREAGVTVKYVNI